MSTGFFICKNCGNNFEGVIYRGQPRIFCGAKCRQAYNNHPDRNPAKTAEARAKMSEAAKGNQNCVGREMSPETRESIGNAVRGKLKGIKRGPSSDETKAKISAYRRGRFTGADNPNWRGGTSPRDWKTTRYKELLQSVWARDVGTCQDCGKKGIKMEVHHIKSWIEAPELRYDSDNAVLLCVSCHRTREKRVITEIGRQRLSQFASQRQKGDDGKFKPIRDEQVRR